MTWFAVNEKIILHSPTDGVQKRQQMSVRSFPSFEVQNELMPVPLGTCCSTYELLLTSINCRKTKVAGNKKKKKSHCQRLSDDALFASKSISARLWENALSHEMKCKQNLGIF